MAKYIVHSTLVPVTVRRNMDLGDLEKDLTEVMEGIDLAQLLQGDAGLQLIANEIASSHSCIERDAVCDHSKVLFLDNVSNKRSLMPCVVCGHLTRPLNHFGVLACFSCRAFFTRAMKDGNHNLFDCRSGRHDCAIDSRSWLSCKQCRFDKCCRAGMSISNESKDKSTNFKAHCIDKIVGEVNGNIRGILEMPSTSLTQLEEDCLYQFTYNELSFGVGYRFLAQLIMNDISVYRILLEFYFHGTLYPLTVVKTLDDYLLYLGSTEAKKRDSPLNRDLSTKDRARLATGNYPLIFEFMATYRLWKVPDLQRDLDLLRYRLCQDSSNEDYAGEIIRTSEQVSKNCCLQPKLGTYESIYNRDQLGLQSPDEVAKHKHTALRLARLGGYNSEEGWDAVHCVLTACIMLYSSDFLDLDEPRKAEKVQAGFASLLYKLVSNNSFVILNILFNFYMSVLDT